MRIDTILNKINIYLFLCFMIVLSACSPKVAQVRPEEPVKAIFISSLEVGKSDERSILTIKATESLQGNYTVIKLSDPPKVVIEIPKVDVGKFEGATDVGNGAIAKVDTSRLNGTGVRMEVTLTSLVEHEVKAEGNTLEIYFAKPQTSEVIGEKVAEKAEAAPPIEEKATAPSAVAEAKNEEKAEASKKALKVIDVKIRKSGKFTIADIITDGEPSDYNVFELKSPDRVIVDIGNAREILARKDIKVNSPHIKGVRLGRYDGRVRVVFDYKGRVQPYEVVKGKNGISIFFGKTSATVVAKVEKAVAKEEVKEKVEEPSQEKSPSPAAVEEQKNEVKTEAPKKALKVTDVKIKKVGKFTRADIILDGAPSTYNVFDLKFPDRVIVDIGNALEISAKKNIKAVSPHIRGARLGPHDGQVRVVFDYKGSVKPYEVVKGSDSISIFFGKTPATVVAKVEKSAAKEEAPMLEEKAVAAAAEAKPETREVAPAAEVKAEEKAEKAAEVDKVEAKPEVTEAAPAIDAKSEAPAGQPVAPPIAEVKAIVKTEDKKDVAPAAESAPPVVESKTVEEVKLVSPKGEAGKVYSGQKVTLEFKDADLKNIFRVIAEVSGDNMIIDPSVTGKLTLRLINVPWDQALDLILETNSLGMTRVGNVIRVLPMALIKKDEQDKLDEKSKKEKQEDLVTKLIPVSYAKASDITARIKGVMSTRGTADVDERTNTIILKDLQKSVDEAGKLVKDLDTPTTQIMIEARIVEAKTDFTRDLGVQWGAEHTADAAHGNPTGYYFPNSYNIAAGGGGSFALNPPASGGTGASSSAGGVLGISFGSINNTLNLDLRLSALESKGWGKVISSPKILTIDNKEATIGQGVMIPYQSISASGTQTQFVPAILGLTVTPHATADGRLNLKIKVNKDSPGVGSPPPINSNSATTEILVQDGETTVIGGIYSTDKGETETYTPFLGRIPIIGWLFKSKSVKDNKTELLIFITPRIVRDKPV